MVASGDLKDLRARRFIARIFLRKKTPPCEHQYGKSITVRHPSIHEKTLALLALQEKEEEEHFTPDDLDDVRDQNLQALLVLLPARLMDTVAKAAIYRGVCHMRKTKTAQAERRRRSLMSTKAKFNHNRTVQQKVPDATRIHSVASTIP